MWGFVDVVKAFLMATMTGKFRNMVLASLAFTALARQLPLVVPLPSAITQSWTGTFLSFFALMWLLYYRYRVIERPKLFMRRTVFNVSIIERLPASALVFRPVFWGWNTHVQTVGLNALNRLDEVVQFYSEHRRETIPAFDGNLVHLDWAVDASAAGLPADAPVFLVLHGIAGSAQEHYCRNICDIALARGWRPVVHDRWRIDFGCWQDVHHAIQHIQALYPDAPIVAAGFSAGAHVLLSYLQKLEDRTPLVGAVVVSPALDLVKMITHMQRAVNASYTSAMEWSIQECVRRHVEHDRHITPDDVREFTTHMRSMPCHLLYDSFLARMRTFAGKEDDDGDLALGPTHPEVLRRLSASRAPNAASAPIDQSSQQPRSEEEELAARASWRARSIPEWYESHPSLDGQNPDPLPLRVYSPFGNGTAPHYARTAANNLHKVKVPTLILLAKDDQILPPSFDTILRRAAANNHNIVYASTLRGGHCAFHEGWYPSGASWGERITVNFLSSLLASHAQTAFLVDVVRRSFFNPALLDEPLGGSGPHSASPAAAARLAAGCGTGALPPLQTMQAALQAGAADKAGSPAGARASPQPSPIPPLALSAASSPARGGRGSHRGSLDSQPRSGLAAIDERNLQQSPGSAPPSGGSSENLLAGQRAGALASALSTSALQRLGETWRPPLHMGGLGSVARIVSSSDVRYHGSASGPLVIQDDNSGIRWGPSGEGDSEPVGIPLQELSPRGGRDVDD